VWVMGLCAAHGTHTLVEHWNGQNWQIVPLADPRQDLRSNYASADYADLTVLSSNNIWVVGQTPSIDGTLKTLVEHWDGRHWSRVPSPNPGKPANIFEG